jgi:hypothetical protein
LLSTCHDGTAVVQGEARSAVTAVSLAARRAGLDTYGHLYPDELDALADRLEDARADALATLARTRRGPAVVPLEKSQVSGLVGGVGGGT